MNWLFLLLFLIKKEGMKAKKTYKETHSLEERKKRVSDQKEKYPDMIPIIVEKGKNCKLRDLERIK